MKRYLILLLCLIMLLSLAACGGQEQPETTQPTTEPVETPVGVDFSGGVSVGLEYVADEENQTCIITGMGECQDTVVIIGQEIDGYQVVGIGDFAFYLNKELVGIALSDTVTSIGEFAFYGCDALREIRMGNGLEMIQRYAFACCLQLERLEIPASVWMIADWAFYSCSGLDGVYIADLDAWFGMDFGSVYANPLRYASDLYLNGELVTDVVVPETVTHIGDWLFEGCKSIESLTVHSQVTYIGERSFRDCDNLTEIHYADTREAWSLIVKDTYWDASMNTYTIYCSDGKIVA